MTVAQLVIPEDLDRGKPVATNLEFDYAYSRQTRKYGTVRIETLDAQDKVISHLEKQEYAIFDIQNGISYITNKPIQGIIVRLDYHNDTSTLNVTAKFDMSFENRFLLLNSINFIDSLNK